MNEQRFEFFARFTLFCYTRRLTTTANKVSISKPTLATFGNNNFLVLCNYVRKNLIMAAFTSMGLSC